MKDSDSAPNSSIQKALTINMDDCKYGTIVEIGAGQEVARQFFRAGGAAGTVAKTMSAYDMMVSDAIYGSEESGRYVSRGRLMKMLDREFSLNIERLHGHRKKNSTYFAYAATVTAKSFRRDNDCHGWVGLRVQLYPGADPSDIVLHVNMMDHDARAQQEALGVLGVNLIYGGYYHYQKPMELISSLLDNLNSDRIEVDMIHFSGPYFEEIDERVVNVELVRSGLSRAVLLQPSGEVAIPAEAFYKKHLLSMMGMFKPITRVNMDMFDKGMNKFEKIPEVNKDNVLQLCGLSINPTAAGPDVDVAELMNRAEMLNTLGFTVMISDFLRFFSIRAYFRRFTKRQIGIVLGVKNIHDIFEESYYEGLEGGILEAFGKLFPDHTRLYVYPARDDSSDQLITGDNIDMPVNLKYLYAHLRENSMIECIEDIDENLLDIHNYQVLEKLKMGRGEWEDMVPPEVVDLIVGKRLLGYDSE